MKRSGYIIENYECPECGTKFPIPRKGSKRRDKDHVKDLWCTNCKKTMKFRRTYK